MVLNQNIVIFDYKMNQQFIAQQLPEGNPAPTDKRAVIYSEADLSLYLSDVTGNAGGEREMK